MKGKNGFSLVEIVIVMAIVAVLVMIAIFGLRSARLSSRNVQRQNALYSINVDIQNYYNEFGFYPSDVYFGGTWNGNVYECSGPSSYDKVCLTDYQSGGSGGNCPRSSAPYDWYVQDSVLQGAANGGASQFDGWPCAGVFTDGSQTQYFFWDNYSCPNGPGCSGLGGVPQGYVIGFCKEGGGAAYLSGGIAPTMTISESGGQTVVTATGTHANGLDPDGVWGIAPTESITHSIVCKSS